jgi:hypothetical protein
MGNSKHLQLVFGTLSHEKTPSALAKYRKPFKRNEGTETASIRLVVEGRGLITCKSPS